jgi:hypothetical protein
MALSKPKSENLVGHKEILVLNFFDQGG